MMPKFDGTGPNGLGSITGRGMGNCPQKNKCSRHPGRGLARGFACRFSKPMRECSTLKEKIEVLESYKRELEKEIDILKKELK